MFISKDEINTIKKTIKLIQQFMEIPNIIELRSEYDIYVQKIKILDNVKTSFNIDEFKIKKENLEKIRDDKLKPYSQKLGGIFPSFSKDYDSLFEMVIIGADLKPLDFMFNTMLNVSNGDITQDDGEKGLGDFLATQFVTMDPKLRHI